MRGSNREVEEIPSTKSPVEKLYAEHYPLNTTSDWTGRSTVRLTFNNKLNKLGHPYTSALRRFQWFE